ncbi:hypothetical protein K469DRAFT_661544 [Zopfia rhizophila CBS 207.26]|uniref:GPI inositol-deacylase winged helix domain-containing protein n=1 Tax=Zopfia rhizophila CBS 207.26 TaxID=1314779 RepID=A0A6A6EAL7_9PEZI|nr:hypothetical protein K469DRAFT_661544 [Zopfia rhizophila CBS 207.26]
MMEFLCQLRQDSANISILITSRAENDIEVAFAAHPRLRIENCQVEVEHDIQSYIDKRLLENPSLRKLPQAVKTDIKDSLMEKCKGMFRWAQCQLDTLSQLRTIRAIRHCLLQLPKSLNETYARILRGVSKDEVEILRRALIWVAFAVMPLTVAELGEAVAIEADIHTLDDVEESQLYDPSDILSIGGCLFSVTDSGYVKLAHLSVKEYLLSHEAHKAPDVSVFAMSPKQANEELATNCITYLSLDTFAGGPAETTEEWETRVPNHPLLKHAAKGWTYYFRQADQTPHLVNVVNKLFGIDSHKTFMSWIQILNSNWIYHWDDYPRHATPLYYAASFGMKDIVDQLIKMGADLNAPGSRFGGTALHGATLREHTSIMKSLLDAGADPSRADFNAITPLHTAVRIGNPTIMELLLMFGASQDASDSLGETPWDWAMKSGQVVSQKLLRGEEYTMPEGIAKPKESAVYQRAHAAFPALAVAQGLKPPSSLHKL